ncbi:hypothetical protein ACFS4T_05820 [Pseudomonas lini]
MNTIYSAVSDSRPQWFKYVGAADQLHYGELEQQLIGSRNDLEKNNSGTSPVYKLMPGI